MPDVIANLGTIILSAGGLGTAAYGAVDGFKLIPKIALTGYRKVTDHLGDVMKAVRRAYGAHADALLRAQYQGGRTDGVLPKSLRQGFRIGLPALDAATIETIADSVGVANAKLISSGAAKMKDGIDLTKEEREAMSRLEVAVDARIDAGLTMADCAYVLRMKVFAGLLAIAVAIAVGFAIRDSLEQNWLLQAFLVGLLAVPVAPIAKDLATAVGEAAKALKAR